jgi:hypothetical protein
MNFKEEKDHTALGIGLISIFAISFTVGLYLYIDNEKQKEIDKYNEKVVEYNKRLMEERASEEKYKRINDNYVNNYNKEKKDYRTTGTVIKLEDRLYANNYYQIKRSLDYKYGDNAFTQNLKPFFDNLTNIQLPTDKIYNIEIVGTISKYGNFFYKLYNKSNIIEYDEKLIKELERFKKIQFRNQRKDIDFNMILTNKYHLIK